MLMSLLSHRDCSLKNVLMDATQMYPLGFHPVRRLFLDDIRTPGLEPVVKYYFVVEGQY